MPYDPQFGANNRLPSSMKNTPWDAYRSNQPVTSYNPQFGKPALSLPRGTGKVARKALLWGGVGVGLLMLANVAFTPYEMHRFWLGVAREFAWLTGTQNGNRLGAFALFTVAVGAVIAFARHSIITRYGSAVFGWIELALGVGLGSVAGDGWHLGHIRWWIAGLMLWGAFILVVWGWENVKLNQGQVAVQPQFPEAAPTPDVYGSARWATPQEVHQAWGGRQSGNDEETVWD